MTSPTPSMPIANSTRRTGAPWTRRSRRRAAARRSRRGPRSRRAARWSGDRSRPRCGRSPRSMKRSTCFSPRPSMSIAPREAKCVSSCQRRPSQSRLGHFVKTAFSGLTVGVPHTGQCFGGFGGPRAARALDLVRRRRDDLRDHVARAQDDDLVARADVLAGEVLLVVQRGELHRDAADVHGLEDRERMQVAELRRRSTRSRAAGSPSSSAGTSRRSPSAGRGRRRRVGAGARRRRP